MTAYVTCEECGGDVPWYYAFEFRGLPHNEPAHPYCYLDKVDEEGCGSTILALIIANEEIMQTAETKTRS